ncbi:hypothetical protein [Halomicrobium zhouii]|uniref:hypothetical protein n=1 Tax=Halomicrobium zhouii TaxID=767519 RepID=UPI001160D422|nr:hypothetical protein [Halomicrobium zhouii]
MRSKSIKSRRIRTLEVAAAERSEADRLPLVRIRVVPLNFSRHSRSNGAYAPFTHYDIGTTVKAAEAAECGLGETMGAFIAWAACHVVDVNDDHEAQMTLRFDGTKTVTKAGESLRKGFRVWTDAGLPEERFRQATVRFPDGSVGQAWRFLNTGLRRVRIEASLFYTPNTPLFSPLSRRPSHGDDLEEHGLATEPRAWPL